MLKLLLLWNFIVCRISFNRCLSRSLIKVLYAIGDVSHFAPKTNSTILYVLSLGKLEDKPQIGFDNNERNPKLTHWRRNEED